MTKQELLKYRKLAVELGQMKDTIDRLDQSITGVRAAALTGMPKGGQPQDLGDRVAKLLDLRKLYGKKWDALCEQMRRIEAAVDMLEDPMDRALVRYKYIDGLTWDEVCEAIHYELRQVHRIHRRALERLSQAAGDSGGRRTAGEETGRTGEAGRPPAAGRPAPSV